MKNRINSFKNAIVFFALFSLLQSCLKDTATKTYTLYSPVYKSVAEVRAGIKSEAPAPIIKPGKIVVLGDYILLNEVDKGIHIIDNTNPSAPINKYFIAIPGNVDVAVKGNILYADLYRDLVTIDISNPSAIKVNKIINNIFPPRRYANFFVQDTTRVIVDWLTKDTIVNALEQQPFFNRGFYAYSASPGLQAQVVSTAGVNGSMARFALLNNYLYTVSDYNLNVLDISTPENPAIINQQNIGWQIETIFPFKNNLFIGSQSGVYIFSTANPAKPTQLSMFGHTTVCDPVIADDNYAYVTLHDGVKCHGTINQLDVLDISIITRPRNVKTYPLTSPHGLAKVGNTLFICDGPAGLKVFDATDVFNLKLTQTFSGINAYDVIALKNNAVVVTADGLYQYDYSNINNITLRSKITYEQ